MSAWSASGGELILIPLRLILIGAGSDEASATGMAFYNAGLIDSRSGGAV